MPASSETDTFGFIVNDLSRIIRAEMDRRTGEAGLGLTTGEGRVLFNVRRAGPIRQTALAERLGIEAMTLSGLVDRLEGKGYVARQPDPADRRAKLVTLTDAGAAVVAQIEPIAAGIRSDAAQGIDPDDWQRLLVALRAARANLLTSRSEAQSTESTAA
ncbi:MarR family transcriptional regulator [Aminobacter sp. P9b]|uniref:DNA-binding MarR family transcriptional regulator n=1 Tax=Aminobacter niigataensis TaxID=83265 RepID=A0ABR6L2B0_9HYPH|nr:MULTISPECIES: MarR family transcriptional regulator [Aminobacter]AWC21728.1 Salmolysin [Aminobacter sp. MSH1]MBB4650860.1 DNA-binding MarR family transcriptional regulator [Aminobacter niigataensis]CAI2932494.1 Salmolysin [Aminobacter niigataensis]